MEFDQIAEFISQFDPWWMIAIAILCFLLDWLFVNNDALSIVGLGIIILAILNFLGVPPHIQLICYPFAFFISYFGTRKFVAKFGQTSVPFEKNKSSDLIGEQGRVIVIKGAMSGAGYYYEYKKDIDVENYGISRDVSHNDILKIKMDDGQIFPAKLQESRSSFEGIDGSLAEIVNIYNGLVVIKFVEN